VIGLGSPNKAGGHDVHGAPLGAAEIEAARALIGWTHAPFEIPADVRTAWDARPAGKALEASWNERFAAYAAAHPELAAEFTRRMGGTLPDRFDQVVSDTLAKFEAKAENIASRKASQNCIEAFAPALPELLGGSADLAGSNLTLWSGSKGISAANPGGNYFYYGVREFGMAAIANGISLHGGFIPYTATFLMFSEYARNALRMAALMKIRQIFVFTHDSIGLGEDGPTHQPVEQTATLRLMPNMDVWRPCDTIESAVAWASALKRADGPSSLMFSRQNLPHMSRDAATTAAIARGGYVLSEAAGAAQVVLIATGSEVSLALAAQKTLAADGIAARVVSMPSTSVFDRQDAAWRSAVLPRGIPRVAVEAGVTDLWRKYVGLEGAVIGLDRFGESAPAGELYKAFGITADAVAAAAREVLGR
jgi:transketolase